MIAHVRGNAGELSHAMGTNTALHGVGTIPSSKPRLAQSSYRPYRGLSRRERRLAFAKRFYEGELPEAALIAYAEWDGAPDTL
jgi:hypothetical protein